ncbi:MAG: RNA polymerase sigma factor [Planctomycetota bacterium]|jgi:RNA polymerase sigma-70 factor (ECF subfamily)
MDIDLEACVRGDKRAWDAFVERMAPVIAAAVRRTMSGAGPDPDEVDDAVQEVFVRLVRDDFRVVRRFDPGRASLTTWLSVVARSCAVDQLRRRRRRGRTTPLSENLPAPDPPAPVEGPAPPLDLLTARQRLVLHLLFDRDLGVPAAARLLGVDEQTVRSSKHKALSRLRAHFDRMDPAEAGG